MSTNVNTCTYCEALPGTTHTNICPKIGVVASPVQGAASVPPIYPYDKGAASSASGDAEEASFAWMAAEQQKGRTVSNAMREAYAEGLQASAPASRETKGAAVAKADQASEWISVDERMPEYRKQVLVIGTGFGPQKRYTTDYYAAWYSEAGIWERWPHPKPPTHWMPLPAAPKGGDK
jgi:hypothetical protein